MSNNVALKELSFEDALTELETIVRDLETGKTDLEKSITSYERGIEPASGTCWRSSTGTGSAARAGPGRTRT